MGSSNILLLTDLSKGSDDVFANAIAQAKEADAFLHVFHVKSPAKVVSVANQLSAKRCIYEDYRTTIKKMQVLAETVEVNINLNLEVSYGNLKGNVQEKIEELNPSFIFIGNRNAKNFFERDGFTKWLNKRNENVLVVTDLQVGSKNRSRNIA